MALWSVSLFTFGGWEGCCGTLCLNKALARNQCPSWLVAEGCDQSHQILAQPFDVQASASSTKRSMLYPLTPGKPWQSLPSQSLCFLSVK